MENLNLIELGLKDQWYLILVFQWIKMDLNSPLVQICMRYRSPTVFSLGGWSPRLPARFHVSRGTPDPTGSASLSCTGLSPSSAGFSKTFLLALLIPSVVQNPGMLASRFRLLLVRSPLLKESMFLSFPPAT